ncbi:uncharacterized protein LOC122442538 [Cervus canadensis]|uniref:uncharacterized protein LOC122442538 n=1 Tax=Cervus canadensis TaxID=1574408 RepID=UPI001C9E85F3|nr:uncharacterized protein LOC122442538 [Cervus canadensis]
MEQSPQTPLGRAGAHPGSPAPSVLQDSQSLPSSSPANKLAVAAGDSTLMTIAGPAAAAGLAPADGTTFPFQASVFKRCAPGGPGGDARPLTSRVGRDSERRCWTRECALAIHVRREHLWPGAAESLRVLMRCDCKCLALHAAFLTTTLGKGQGHGSACSFSQPQRWRQGVGSTGITHGHPVSQLGCCNKNRSLGRASSRHQSPLHLEARRLGSRCPQTCLLVRTPLLAHGRPLSPWVTHRSDDVEGERWSLLLFCPPASWLQADRLGPPSSQHQSRPLEPLPESEAPAAPGEQVSPSALPPRPRASLALDPDPADVCPGGPCSQEPSRTPARPTRPSTPPAPTPPPVPHAQSLSWFLWLSLPFLTSGARRGHPSGPPSPKAPSCVVHCICLSLSHPRCPET